MLKLLTALSLAASARKRKDVSSGLSRALGGLVAPWMTPSLLLHVKHAHGERDVEADPQSLGLLFEDTDYMWWWVRTVSELPVYTCVFVRTRSDAHDMGPVIATGDEVFDGRFVASRHPSMAACHEHAIALLKSPTVRQILLELLPRDGDDCTIGSHISLTRHRTSGSFDDVIVQMERVAALADAQEAVFRPAAPYR